MNKLVFRFSLLILLALALTILPLPSVLSLIRPPWVLLLMLFIEFFVPALFSVFLVLLLGLTLDVLLSSVIGEHVFALIVVTWIASSKSRRFHLFSLGQQVSLLGILVCIYQVCLYMLDAMLGYHSTPWIFLTATVMSAVLWPWFKFIAEDLLLSGMTLRRY